MATWLRSALRGVTAVLLLLGGAPPAARADEGPVDVALVLAVDISLSMDLEELELQRAGYAAALRDPEVLAAIAGGLHGRIALSYVEWAGWGSAETVLPWSVIDGPASGEAAAARLIGAPVRRQRRTSISGALEASESLLARLPMPARRRVVDVSGDGPNNDGPRVDVTRDRLLADGIIINGLPIMIRRARGSWFDIDELDRYFEACVIGGPGAFVLPVQSADRFAQAIRTKLVLEISDAFAPARLVPAQAEPPSAATPPPVPCDIGERMWGRGSFRTPFEN